MIANADMTEVYNWTPTNSAEVITFANHVRGLTDQNATLTLTDDPPAVAPSFADDTGDAQTWEMGTAIAAITVPEADGTPEPTYAVEGVLPAGIAFDTDHTGNQRHAHGDGQWHNHHPGQQLRRQR